MEEEQNIEEYNLTDTKYPKLERRFIYSIPYRLIKEGYKRINIKNGSRYLTDDYFGYYKIEGDLIKKGVPKEDVPGIVRTFEYRSKYLFHKKRKKDYFFIIDWENCSFLYNNTSKWEKLFDRVNFKIYICKEAKQRLKLNIIKLPTTIVYRKYIKKGVQKDRWKDISFWIVEGKDGKQRFLNFEAINYYKNKGFNSLFSIIIFENYVYSLFELIHLDDFPKNLSFYFEEDNRKNKIINKLKKDLESLEKTITNEERNKLLNYYHKFGMAGYPDLFVWDEKTKKYFFVEVKSEKDVLRDSQKKWIQSNLLNNKFKVEILKIKNKI